MKLLTAFFIILLAPHDAESSQTGSLVYRLCSPDYGYRIVKKAHPWNAPRLLENQSWVQLSGSNDIISAPSDLVKLDSECFQGQMSENFEAQLTPPAIPTPTPTPSASFTFPTLYRPTANYKSGQRAFGAGRSGGRSHAACDLYRVTGEDAVAIGRGKVIRDKYYFYEGTYAIEIKLDDGRVARYGEITSRTAPGVALNKIVNRGQVVGYIGKVNSGCCEPMLHFELYSGKATGPLTQSGNKYQRRSDLIDPSKWLTSLEKEKFGTSYPFEALCENCSH